MNPLKAGDTAPKFSLPDQDGEQVNLADFRGQRVLVYFYPKAMTPGCTVQACGLRDNMDELKRRALKSWESVRINRKSCHVLQKKSCLTSRCCRTKITRYASSLASGVKKPLWVKPTTASTASVSWSMPTARLKKCSTISKRPITTTS